MIVGTEWLIDAEGCNAEKLREVKTLQEIFARIIKDLQLKSIGEPQWHKFPAEFGVTGLVMLTESHLACHTYPELNNATFNLYCCRERPEWNWTENLRELLGAESVTVRKVTRGTLQPKADTQTGRRGDTETNPQSKIQNPKSKIAGGNR